MGDEEEFQAWKAAKQGAAPSVSPDAEFDAWKASRTPKAPVMPTKLAIAKRNASMPHPEDMQDDEPSYARQALGGIAALGHDIPGAEALQAMGGMRSLDLTKASDRAQFGGAYKESLDNLKSAEGSANKWVRRGNNLIGGTIAAAATPGKSVALQGARFGVGEALGTSDPVNLKDRLDAVPMRAAIDATAGKVFGEIAPNVLRVIKAKSLGKNVLERTRAMEAADIPAYGKAKAEGDLAAANPTPQAVSDALNDTDIKPYVAVVRGSGIFKGAADATVLREAYKLMSEKERMLGNRIISSDDYKAGSELEKQEITSGKRKLLSAGDQVMPSFRSAVRQHAEAEGNLDALKQAADATKRIVNGTDITGKNLATKTPEAFKVAILMQRKAEAQAAREGVLGKLKEKAALSGNPFKLFGVPKSIHRINKMAPYINALDDQTGNTGSHFRRALGITVGAHATK